MDRRELTRRSTFVNSDAYSVKAVIGKILRGICLGICAYFSGVAELPFGARPFGVALLAASRREALFVYVGLVISALTTLDYGEAMIYFAIYTALILFRIFSRLFLELRGGDTLRVSIGRAFDSIFEESVGARVALSAIFGVLLGIVMLFAGGWLYYDLFALLIISLLAPVTAFLLCEAFEKAYKAESRIGALRSLGLLALFCITVFGARATVIYGVSASVFAGLMITFYVTCVYGVGYGSICGLALGVCYSPMLLPVFVFSALSMGILQRFSVPLACFTAFFASCAWSFYVQGISALLGTFGGILSACLLYTVVYKAFLLKSEPINAKDSARSAKKDLIRCKVMPDNALDGVRLYEMNSRMSAISDGLYRLSLFFEDMRASGVYASDAGFCDENYNTGFACDVSAPEYRALSALLAKAMESESNEYSTDRELSKRLCGSLSDLELDIFGVLVYGVRKKTIYIKSKSKEKLVRNARLIIETVAPLLPFAVSFEDFDIRKEGDKDGAMLIYEREKNSVSVVRRRVTACGEEVCGDSVAVFKNKDNRFFAFISDGMGSGSTASAVSGITVGFLCNMLNSGRLSEELIGLLNGFLCTRLPKNTLECSATLDLFELDLMNGHASVYKCGAAPSYVFRRGRLFKLRSESMPVGILNEVDLKSFEFELCHGDVIVMVSDGVMGEGAECSWLFDLLAQNLPNRSLERTAELIVKYATAKGSSDDITVVLVKVG